MLNYIATEPYVQVAFLILIGFSIGACLIYRKWHLAEKNDWKREVQRHEWTSKSKDLVVAKTPNDLEGM